MTSLDGILKLAIQPLEDAQSLPFSAYTDDRILDAEAQHLFAKEWLFVCMAAELSNPGDYFALNILREPVVLVRGGDNALRVFSNICRHRGTKLLDDGFGQIDKFITCPYHAWAYSSSGELKAIPHNKIIAVDRATHGLIDKYLTDTNVAVDTWPY